MIKTILTVDDSSSIRQLLSSTLEGCGYRVIDASNGKEGLEKLMETSPDLIISDLHMPYLDGIGFIQLIRSTSLYRFVPIIMLTTENQAALKQAGTAAGATAWLTKPFKPHELLSVIKRVLG